jgi:hypothetical protein
MAKQRQTDVNINYRVNTVEVDKANVVLNKASQSTDKLRIDTQNFGNVAGKAFQGTSKYIEGMEINLARLRQQIKLTNTQDTARLQQLSTQYKNLKAQVDAYNKSLLSTSQASKQAAASSKDLASQFGQVVTAVKTFIAAGIAREIVNVGLEMAKLNGQVEGVERAFNRAFPGGASILNDLRKATHGTVSDFELMQRTLQATNLGVSVDELGVLFEFAATRAQQTGESVDYLVDSIVRGIGRKSPLILDNLGLSAVRLKEKFDGAALASQSVADVTRVVGEIAREELQKMGGFAENSATAVDQLTVSWQELKEEVAKALTGEGGGIAGTLKGYVDSFRALVEAFNRGISVSEVFAEKQTDMIALASANEFIQRRFTADKKENIKVLEEEIAALTKGVGGWTKLRDINNEVIEQLRDEKKQLNERVKTSQMSSFEASKRMVEIEEEIKVRKNLTEANKDDAIIDQAIIKILRDKLLALQQQGDGKTGKRALPAELKQTVDLDLKNPVTGEIGKYDKDNIIKAFNAMVNLLPEGTISAIVQPVEIRPMDSWDHIAQEFADNWKNIVSTGLQDTTMIIDSFIQADADKYDIQLAHLSKFYDEQIRLAGDNERAKFALATKREKEEQKLRKKAFEADKEAKRLSAVINGAAGVINAFATLPYPAALVASVLIAAQTGAQIAVIDKQQYKGFAKGVIDLKGPGTGTSDSINARLSKGESVMTAQETSSSKSVLRAIRAKKLNDKVLKEIISGRSRGHSSSGIDIKPIVDGLKDLKDSQPDIVLRSNLVYEGRKKGDSYKQWIRSKSMSS